MCNNFIFFFQIMAAVIQYGILLFVKRYYRANQSLLYAALPVQQQKGGKMSTRAPTTPILGKHKGGD